MSIVFFSSLAGFIIGHLVTMVIVRYRTSPIGDLTWLKIIPGQKEWEQIQDQDESLRIRRGDKLVVGYEFVSLDSGKFTDLRDITKNRLLPFHD